MARLTILDSEEIASLAFCPRFAAIQQPFVVHCADATLACHFHQVAADAYTVVFFHGNGEVVADYVEVLPRILSMIDCNSFLVEYRGYGGSTGTPTISNLLNDCGSVLSQVPTSPEKMIFFGRSLGCVAAAYAASVCPEARGLILESGIDDLYEHVTWLLSRPYINHRHRSLFSVDVTQADLLRDEVHARCDIRKAVSEFRGFGLVSCSTKDEQRRQDASERLFSWMTQGKRILRSSDADHNSMLIRNIRVYCEAIRDMCSGSYGAN